MKYLLFVALLGVRVNIVTCAALDCNLKDPVEVSGVKKCEVPGFTTIKCLDTEPKCLVVPNPAGCKKPKNPAAPAAPACEAGFILKCLPDSKECAVDCTPTEQDDYGDCPAGKIDSPADDTKCVPNRLKCNQPIDCTPVDKGDDACPDGKVEAPSDSSKCIPDVPTCTNPPCPSTEPLPGGKCASDEKKYKKKCVKTSCLCQEKDPVPAIPPAEAKCPKGYEPNKQNTETCVRFVCNQEPCGDTNPLCAAWQKNGFCDSTFYSNSQKKKYCGDTCKLCNRNCKDLNPNCRSWVERGFCTDSSYTDEERAKECPRSCDLCGGVKNKCVDARAFCATWNRNGFCRSTGYTTSQKKQACAKTCNLC